MGEPALPSEKRPFRHPPLELGELFFFKLFQKWNENRDHIKGVEGAMTDDAHEIARAHGLDDKEIEELEKEFRLADADGTGRINQSQLRKLVFNRLYNERHPAKLASMASVQFESGVLPGDVLSVNSSEGFGLDKRFSVGEAASSPSSLPVGQKEPARDTLDQSSSNGRRRKSLSSASSSANASPLAGVSAANHMAQASSWGNPDMAAYSWQTQFAVAGAGQRRSMMAKDSVLGRLPKEYMEDAETAKLVASTGVCTPTL